MKLIKVKRFETMESICEREYQNRGFVSLLAQFNGLSRPDHIYPNLMLHIPTKLELKAWVEEHGGDE